MEQFLNPIIVSLSINNITLWIFVKCEEVKIFMLFQKHDLKFAHFKKFLV